MTRCRRRQYDYIAMASRGVPVHYRYLEIPPAQQGLRPGTKIKSRESGSRARARA